MCIFAGPVEKVSGTRIFVSRNGNLQFTAYQMEVELASSGQPHNPLDPWANRRPSSTAMILPVPIETGSRISLVDMSNSPEFFDRINRAFEEVTRGRSMTLGLSKGVAHLEVFDVGDYKVSIAYSVDDIDRADPSVFTLGADAAEVLRAHYSEGFAFVIASLKQSGKVSPLGYISQIPSLALETPYPMFIPTRHEHGGGAADWDHSIYIGGTGRFSNSPGETVSVKGGEQNEYTVRQILEQTPALQPFLSAGPSTRMRAKGLLQNTDLAAGV